MFVIASRLLVPKGFSGMALFPFILLRRKEDARNAVMLNHERIHLRQQAELLIVFFYVWYLAEFVIWWFKTGSRSQAYRNIIFEREAYSNEKDLLYLKKRPLWNFLKY